MKSYPYRTTEERWRRLRATAGSRDLSVKEALDQAVDEYVKTYNLYVYDKANEEAGDRPETDGRPPRSVTPFEPAQDARRQHDHESLAGSGQTPATT